MHEIDELPEDALAALEALDDELLPEVPPRPVKAAVGHARHATAAIKTDRDHWRVRILGEDGREVEDYPTHWRPDNPFAESTRVMLTRSRLTRRERQGQLEDYEEMAALGMSVPRLIVPAEARTIEVSRDLTKPRPGQVRLARWRVAHLAWETRQLHIPEDWTVPPDLAELYAGYDWDRLRGYEMQPWQCEWAAPHESWYMDFGRRPNSRTAEPIYFYVRITESLPFPDDSIDSSRFMALLTRLHDPDPWHGHKIVGRNLIPAAVDPISLIGLHPNVTNGFRKPPASTATKPKPRKRR